MQRFLFCLIVIASGCQSKFEYIPERDFKNIEKSLITQFISARDSSVIQLEEGHFVFSTELILEGKNYITIKGKGIDKTVLSWKGQKSGAEGILVKNCSHIVFEDLTVEDALGDNIKVNDTENITFRRIKSAWTGEVDSTNGAYGLYPVICKNVLIENCEVMGASDAGIYVGQSENVVIRNNKVWWNVAGIESENSENVAIYNNEAFNNTGGILVFDLPGLTRYGKNIEVYENKCYENNFKNFAPKGNIVASVPPGTGIMILATQNVKVFNNEIKHNKTVNSAIVSYVLVAAMSAENNAGNNEGSAQRVNNNYKLDTLYNPYPQKISFNKNSFENHYWFTDLGNDFGKLFMIKFGFSRPDIIWDGIRSENYYLADKKVNPEAQICINENEKISSADLDAANDFKNIQLNPNEFKCN